MRELARHTAMPHHRMTALAKSIDIHGCVFHTANIAEDQYDLQNNLLKMRAKREF